MSDATKIDTLSIEIVTNSNNAIDNLEDLAIAMEDIKKQGKISTAVKNLQGLAESIRKIAESKSPTANLNAIKDGMEAIKQVGSITTTTNRVDKLVETMGKVARVDLTGAKEKFESIKDALSGLSEIKSNGFGSMVNGLGKIDKVTKALSEVDEDGVDVIDRFAERVEKLTEKLTPLSEKMTTIQEGLKGIKTHSRSAGSGMSNFSSKVNIARLNAATFTTVLQGTMRILKQLTQALTKTVATAIEWEGIAARFGRGFGSSAQETYDWIKRLNSEMNINTQDFMQYSSVYATMLTGYGVAQEDAAKMALGYTELTYDIWAGYNDIYKTFDDAAVAVRAAIAGETEPIQKAGLDVRDSALKQIAALNGVEYSTQGATQAQKSYLRYLALVDQAQDQSLVGAYAAEMNTAEGAVRTLAQQIKSLGQALGSILLPVLSAIVPWVQAFVELLTEAIVAVAGFFGLDIQPVDFSYSSGLGDITSSAEDATDAVDDTTNALKDLKKATIGIDELNVISPQTDNSSSSGNSTASGWSGLDVDSLWDESIFNAVNNHVDELKEKLKGILPIIGGIALAFAGWRLLDLLSDMDDVVTKFPKLSKLATGLGKTIATVGITLAVGKLSWDFTGAFLEEGNWASLGGQLGTTVLGAAVAAWLAGPLGAGIVLAASGIVALSRLCVEVKNGTVEFSDPESIATSFVGVLETLLGGALVIDKLSGGKIGTAVTGAVSTGLMKAFGGTTFGWLASTFSAKITGALSAVGGLIAAHPVITAIVAAIAAAIGFAVADYDFTEIGRKVGEWLGSACRWLVDTGTAIAEWAASIGEGIEQAVSDALDWLASEWEGKSVWECIGWIVFELPGDLLAKFFEVGTNIVLGIIEGVKDEWENFCGNLSEFFTGLYEGFCAAFGINSPAETMKPIGRFIVEGIWEGFSGWDIFTKIGEWAGKVWQTIKGWFGGGQKTEESVDVEVKLVKKDWSTVKDWIGRIDTLDQPIALQKEGWATVPQWVGTIPTMSIPMRLEKSGWSSVASWLGNLNFRISFTLPNIGINWSTRTQKGFSITYPSSFYTYAMGGFPDFGEMFIARENGPELVGRIGSKSTVANNEQIVEGVSEGVYSAVMAANQASSGNTVPKVQVFLDGRQITASVEKTQRDRGATITKNGVYAY